MLAVAELLAHMLPTESSFGGNVQSSSVENRRLGVAVVGLGGAVASTAAAGVELIRQGATGTDGLPLAGLEALVPYENLVFEGWDLCGDDLASAVASHGILPADQLQAAKPALVNIRPWPAVVNPGFCRNASGTHCVSADDHRGRTEIIREDLRRFREENDLDGVVLVNLASVERTGDPDSPALASVEAFERGLDEEDPDISPAMLYAYAAIMEGVPYINFTPSVAADTPALTELARREGVPVAGKDGKTGQTMIKTVLAPAFRSRALRVDGWFSTNILGNGDGHILSDPDSLASKIDTKGSVLDDMLGYEVPDHIVNINYYRPRGDDKEAWDNVDLTGFLGQRMQIKVNFLCSDSALAAPLVLDLARLADLAKLRGDSGAQEQFGLFFKAPMVREPGSRTEHAFHAQEDALFSWLKDETHINGNGKINGKVNVTVEGEASRESR